MNKLSFPRMGLDFTINRMFFGSGIYWYGIIIAAAFLLGVGYAFKKCRRFGVSQDDMCDVLIAAVPLAVIGARLFYVLGDWNSFKGDLSRIFMIRDGGLAIYGAVIMSAVAVFIMSRIKKINPLDVLDIGGLGLLIGQAVGRWGNLINAEVYGRATDLPWGMVINGAAPVHPLFLYESLWNILGFLLIRLRVGRRIFRGEVFLMYIGWYGMGRAIFEGLRDSAFVLKAGDLPISQIMAVLTLFGAIILLAVGYSRVLKKGAPEGINDILPEPVKEKKKKAGEGSENQETESEEAEVEKESQDEAEDGVQTEAEQEAGQFEGEEEE